MEVAFHTGWTVHKGIKGTNLHLIIKRNGLTNALGYRLRCYINSPIYTHILILTYQCKKVILYDSDLPVQKDHSVDQACLLEVEPCLLQLVRILPTSQMSTEHGKHPLNQHSTVTINNDILYPSLCLSYVDK